jgi:hypothetical protein
MRWLLVTHELNSISKQCIDLLQVAGQNVSFYQHQGQSSIEKIAEKINNEKPDRILIVINENKSAKLVNHLSDHLLIPVYFAQATIHSYSPIPILVLNSTTEDQNLNIIQNATDQLIDIYPHILKYFELN